MKNYTSLTEIQDALEQKRLRLPELLKYYFEQIDKKKHLNAFNEVFFDSATAQAEKVQQKIDAGIAGKLAGMVIGIKDNICYRGHIVSASSKMLENFIAPYSATVVERLLAEDALIIGRLNCDEFAMGGSNETSYFGAVKNAADEQRVSGGSSGGSAVAVQAGLCLAALGTDTGGSVRQPAAFCGCIGLKPTYGRISRYGVIAYASSFDQVGTLTRSVSDAAILLEVLAGPDTADSTASLREITPYLERLNPGRRMKIAVWREAVQHEALDPEISQAISNGVERFKNDGHEVNEISFDLLDYMVPAYYVLTTAEASSNLSRYDGVHYGYRNPDTANLTALYKKSRAEGFGEEVKRRIMLGTFVLSAGYYDAYYQKAQKVRMMIRKRAEQLLQEYDILLCPVSPVPAFKTGERNHDPLQMYMADIYTVFASLAGIPAVSIPLGNNTGGLPLAMQLMSGHFNEQALLDISHSFLD